AHLRGEAGGVRGRQAGKSAGVYDAIGGEGAGDEARRKNVKSNEGFYAYRNDAPAAAPAKSDPGAFKPADAAVAVAEPAPAPKRETKPMSDTDKAVLTMTGGKRSETQNKLQDQAAPQPQAQARKI